MNTKLTVYIERWSASNGRVSYPWSVWEGGRRLDMGDARGTPEEAEAAARAYCLSERGRAPDKVVRL
ncbi:MAG: hypothetical protein WD673_01615 [Alphaproteobacteria bacterium]